MNFRDYLQTEHRATTELVTQLVDTLKVSVEAFFWSDHYDAQTGWPYEVEMEPKSTSQAAKAISPALAAKRRSVSTNAMILHSLTRISNEDRVSKQLPRSVLSPKNAWVETLDIANRQPIPDATNLLEGHLLGLDQRPIVSSTYGDNDPFSLCWLLELKLISPTAPQLDSAVKFWIDAFKKDSFTPQFLNSRTRQSEPVAHALPGARIAHILHFLKKRLRVEPWTRELVDLSNMLLPFLERCLEKQIAAQSIGSFDYDAAEMIFAIDGCLHLESRKFADHELVRKLIAGAVSRNGADEGEPPWFPKKPILRTERGMALSPLAVEVAMSLLRIAELLDKPTNRGVFNEIRPSLEGYGQWLLTRAQRNKENEFAGWYSEHSYGPGKIHLWETAVVAGFVSVLVGFLRRHQAETSLQLTGLVAKPRNREPGSDNLEPSEYWDLYKQFYDPLSGITAINSTDSNAPADWSTYQQVNRWFLQPRSRTGKKNEAEWSMLLYGPAGTGKTTIAEALAESLRWPLITITPSDFLLQGENLIESRAKEIFEALREQREAVVLFDEIDQLISDRSSDKFVEQGDMLRLMTPSMLVKLQDLHDQKNVVFLVATNYEERIDGAIKRKGRFDYHFLVSIPNRASRAELLRRLLGSQLVAKNRGDYNSSRPKKQQVPDPFLGNKPEKLFKSLTDLGVPNTDLLFELVPSTDKSKLQVKLDDLAAVIPLAGYGEIKHIAREIAASVGSGKNLMAVVDDQIKKFMDNPETAPKAFQLESYKSRLKGGTPLPEFLLSCGLFLESETNKTLKDQELNGYLESHRKDLARIASRCRMFEDPAVRKLCGIPVS